MWILRTLIALLLQVLEFGAWLVWKLLQGLARLIGLGGWKRVATGEEYEQFVAHYLKQQGFRILEHPGGSGDMGVDLVAKKGLKIYAVQCKFYSGSVDGSAVQQVVAGKVCYGCNAALVVTNSVLTPGARALAQRNAVEIWEEISPAAEPGSLRLEGILTPLRLAGIALGLLGSALLFSRMGWAQVQQEPVRFGLLSGACFGGAFLVLSLLRGLWRALAGEEL